MKLSTKSILFTGLVALSVSALADDPIVGVWQTYEDGQAKAQVQISQSESDNTFTGKIIEGNTEKAKKYEGEIVLKNLTAQGDGKYKGKAKDPRWPFSVSAKIKVNGKDLTISTLKGDQNWKKIK
ncbi:hypothetical protein MOMA_03945 [Moraxella macacae 0408225]|uniref:Uncharacterized protein n=1 Tax=Moraxella macacae 0408225 TaxID=1230338 RepID=L2F9D6_9GAMM|nr:DUF2147 domain-containing protein [Moraxella macacae]ELA09525.1 hypothetical protein MOMA_03945 [Moraxella macacae 0408225]